MSNIEEAISRCEYASELLKAENIPHIIKNSDIGHINILGFIPGEMRSRVVMSFWARTGKMLFTMNTEWYEQNKITNNDLGRGIKNLINTYKKYFKGAKQ